MKIKVSKCVFNSTHVSEYQDLQLMSHLAEIGDFQLPTSHLYAYTPLINSHDHLVGNWLPKAGKNRPYPTTDIWVEEMKTSPSYLERNKVWFNDGKFNLLKGNAKLLTTLGIYKNIFSGCHVVQDHAPNQKKSYYEQFPIYVPENYRQCHSISLGNWWGGKSARSEWKSTKGKMPFILHLAEGTNEKARSAFGIFERLNLLKPNSLIIHGIALVPPEIKKCAQVGTSICCCPESNLFLIGRTIDIPACMEYGVNLVLGTDSTMSGSFNLLAELKIFHREYPQIAARDIYRFITENAARALMLPEPYGRLSETTSELLLLEPKDDDPFQNLLQVEIPDIALLVHKGTPIYGDAILLSGFKIKEDNYYFFSLSGRQKFVIGHPEKIIDKVDSLLGYHKEFHYIPF
ncbi:MAG: amidohydrolase family protein [Candidatus Cloacimonetes bacterium]|nr:amidohydrolase family protein [Candidatus Cloacimonadota bacterium]